MAPTICSTLAPLWRAMSRVRSASWLASRAASALCCTAALSWAIEEAVCSSALAWASVRPDRSWLPWAISPLARATPSAPPRTWATMGRSRARICCWAAISWPTSLLPWGRSAPLRSPPATAWANSTACPSGRVMERTKALPKATASSSRAASAPTMSHSMRWADAARSWTVSSNCSVALPPKVFTASMPAVSVSK